MELQDYYNLKAYYVRSSENNNFIGEIKVEDFFEKGSEEYQIIEWSKNRLLDFGNNEDIKRKFVSGMVFPSKKDLEMLAIEYPNKSEKELRKFHVHELGNINIFALNEI